MEIIAECDPGISEELWTQCLEIIDGIISENLEILEDEKIIFRLSDSSVIDDSWVVPTEDELKINIGGQGEISDIIFTIYHEFKHVIDIASGKLQFKESILGHNVYYDGELSLSPLEKMKTYAELDRKILNSRDLEMMKHEIYCQYPHELAANVYAAMHHTEETCDEFMKISQRIGREYLCSTQ